MPPRLLSGQLEPGGLGGWPWLRSFPFGTEFNQGDLSKLVAASSVRADARGMLFAFRGTWGYSKPSRDLLAESEARDRARWTETAERLMAHAPQSDHWSRRYLIDLKQVEYFKEADGQWAHRTIADYESGANLTYVDIMREAVFTVSPPGDLWEAYRTWEAMEAGSIPIVVENATYKEEGCVQPAAHLLATAPFVVSVRSWEELPDVLERVASNMSAVMERQAAMRAWLAERKAEVRTELIETSRAMRTPRAWRPGTSCQITPLTPQQIAEQQRTLAKFWRRPQDGSTSGRWHEQWSAADAPRRFRGEGSWCKRDGETHGQPNGEMQTKDPEDFSERCYAHGCMPPLIAAFECAALE